MIYKADLLRLAYRYLFRSTLGFPFLLLRRQITDIFLLHKLIGWPDLLELDEFRILRIHVLRIYFSRKPCPILQPPQFHSSTLKRGSGGVDFFDTNSNAFKRNPS
ncbi:hypothetical protein J6590_060913, partial [Homalodisca vitripennis]